MKSRQKTIVLTRHKLAKGRILVKKGEIWYLETCQRGLQSRRSLGTGDFNKAMELQLSLGSAQDELPSLQAKRPKKAEPSALSIGKAFDEYKAWYEKNKRASGARRALPVVRLFMVS